MTWRSAGELLGEQQSGQMTEIGLAMYLDMLDHAVKALKEGREPALDKPLVAATEVELRLPAFVPETYIADVHVRLSLYKRIAAAESNEALDELNTEMFDRFGPLPAAAQSLLKIAGLKLLARSIGVRRLDIGPQGGSVTFEERNSIDPGTVVRMVQKGARDYRLEGPLKMRLTRQLPTEEQRFTFAEALLKLLGEKPKAEHAPAGGVAKPTPASRGPKR
jgi:transcription-repair coupling factor (superfamily II helicase)